MNNLETIIADFMCKGGSVAFVPDLRNRCCFIFVAWKAYTINQCVTEKDMLYDRGKMSIISTVKTAIDTILATKENEQIHDPGTPRLGS